MSPWSCSGSSPSGAFDILPKINHTLRINIPREKEFGFGLMEALRMLITLSSLLPLPSSAW